MLEVMGHELVFLYCLVRCRLGLELPATSALTLGRKCENIAFVVRLFIWYIPVLRSVSKPLCAGVKRESNSVGLTRSCSKRACVSIKV